MDESISNEDLNSVDDSIIDDDDTTSFPSTTERESVLNINYEVLTADEIVQYVKDYVKEVNSIVELSTTVTRLLLSQCKWDKRVLVEKFFEDPEKLFKEARVINPFNKLINSVSQTNQCEICLLELESTSSTALDCGHRFCAACWSEYLRVKIMHEGFDMSIPCAASDCDIIIDDDTVFELVNDSEVKLMYQHLITNSFVQQNQLLRWCPAPACSFAMKLDYSPLRLTVCKCKCEYEFCFDCGSEWHEPVSCEMLRRFLVQENEGLFLTRLMQRNTSSGYDDKIKICPGCTVSVQRISGCHVMQCKNCCAHFCWDCLKRFKTKSEVYFHMCAREKNAEVEGENQREPNESWHEYQHLVPSKNITGPQMALKTYPLPGRQFNLTYYYRYVGQTTSLRVTTEQCDRIRQSSKSLEIKTPDLVQLEQIAIVLRQCQQTLKYSSIFALYLEKVDQSLIFEGLYDDLETVTKNLSVSISGVNLNDLDDFKTMNQETITRDFRYCEKGRRALLNYIDEGYDNEWWKFGDLPNEKRPK